MHSMQVANHHLIIVAAADDDGIEVRCVGYKTVFDSHNVASYLPVYGVFATLRGALSACVYIIIVEIEN